MDGYYAMGTFVSGHACNQSRVYSGTAKSVKSSSSQGYSEGDNKYRACIQYVDLPAGWSYQRLICLIVSHNKWVL